jgi:uncharacterized protein (TIGR00290 family)
MKKRTLLSWSSGKDCAWALHVLRRDPGIEICGLFTSVNEAFERVSMHATRCDLLQKQAAALALPLEIIRLPEPCSNRRYEAAMGAFVRDSVSRGITHMAFGDLFLEDVRAYRVRMLEKSGIEPLFPLWGTPTAALCETMLSAGVEAYLSCVDLEKLPARLAGERWSRELIAGLPRECDPCGENGEFHTVAVNGPMFRERIPVCIGGTVVRDGFAFADIEPWPVSRNK